MAEESYAPVLYWVRHYSRLLEARVLTGLGSQQSYGIWYVHDGTLTARKGSEKKTLRPGYAAITEPGWDLELTYGASCLSAVGDLFWRPKRSGAPSGQIDAAAQPQPSWQQAFGTELPWPLPGALAAEARALTDHLQAFYWRDPLYACECSSRFGNWLLHCALTLRDRQGDTDQQAAGNSTEADLARQLDDLMRRRFSVLASIEELAELVKISPASVHRVYRHHFNSTPAKALERYRLERAQVLLARPELNITDIAEKVGYSSNSVFTRAFKRQYGVTPKAWRTFQS